MNEQETTTVDTVQQTKYVRFGEQMAFNISAMFRDMSHAILGQFPTFWVTVLGNEGISMAALQVAQRVWDGLTDPAVGAYFDRQAYTNEKARRFFKLTALPITLLLVLMFMPFRFHSSDNINAWIHAGFILLLYLPFDPLHSLSGTAFMSHYNSITPNIKERSGIIARSRLFSNFGSAAVGGLPMIFGWFSDGPEDVETRRTIFIIAVIIIGAAFLLYNLLMYTKVKERIVSPPQPQQKILRIFLSMLKNKLFLILVLANTIGGLISRGSTDQWFFEYNIQNISWQGYVSLIGGLPAMLLVTFIWPKLCNYFEKRDIIIGAAAVRLIIRGLYLFIGTRPGILNLTGINTSWQAKTFMSSVAFLNEIPNAMRGQMYWSMLADSIDYGEWKTGKRNDGVVYTTEGLMGKFVGAIGTASTGLIITFINLEPQAPTQSAATMRGLFTVPLSIELLSIACSTVPFFFYDLKRAQHAQMVEELKARAVEAQAAELMETVT